MNDLSNRLPAGLTTAGGPMGLLLVTLVLLVSFPRSSTPPQQSPSGNSTSGGGVAMGGGGSASAPGDKGKSTGYAALDLLRTHFGDDCLVPPHDSPTPGMDRVEYLRGSFKRFLEHHEVDLYCLVATIADPVDSHMQLSFDGQMAAMMRAAERADFLMARHRLLWQTEVSEVARRESSRRASAVLLKGPVSEGSKRPQYLLMLLVGETPTAGLHVEAFREALDTAACLEWCKRGVLHKPVLPDVHWVASHQRTRPHGDEPNANAARLRLRILGPSYSGSSESLIGALKHWWSDFRREVGDWGGCRVDVRTGSATSDDNRDKIEYPPANDRKASKSQGAPLKVRFSTCIRNDSSLMAAVLCHLRCDRGIDPSEIVLLTEANTSYGSDIRGSPFERENRSPASGSVVQDECECEKTKGSSTRSKSQSEIRTVVFPLAISRVRRAYGEGGNNVAPVDPLDLGGRTKHLPLRASDARNAVDVLPQFSPDSMAVNDIVIEQILTSVIRSDVRAIGIIGSDPRDKLFLASRIRQFAPDVLLFTTEADVLYSHSDFASSTNGMIVASSYPLFSRSQRWFSPAPVTSQPIDRGDSEAHFNAETTQGIFNATLSLINEQIPKLRSQPRPLVDYDFHELRPAGVGSQWRRNESTRDERVPPIWLLTTHRHGFWPVKIDWRNMNDASLFRPAAPKRKVSDEPKRRLNVDRPSTFLPAWITLLNALFILTVWLINPCIPRGSALHALWLRFLQAHPRILTSRWAACFRTTRRSARDWGLRAFPWLDLTRPPRRLLAANSSERESIYLSRLAYLAMLGGSLAAIQAMVLFPILVHWRTLFIIDSPSGIISCVLALMTSGSKPYALISFAAMLVFVGLLASVGWFCLVIIHEYARERRFAARRSPVERLEPSWHRYLAASFLDRMSLVVGLATVLLGLVLAWSIHSRLGQYQGHSLVLLERIGTYRSDVMPIVPLLILFLIVGVWAVCQLRRLAMSSVSVTNISLASGEMKAEGCASSTARRQLGIEARWCDLRDHLSRGWIMPSSWQDWLVAVVFVGSTGHVFLTRWLHTVENNFVDGLLKGLLPLAAWLLTSLVLRLRANVALFLRLLQRLALHPVLSAFARVPERLAKLTSGHVFAAQSEPEDVEYAVRCLEQLANLKDRGVLVCPELGASLASVQVMQERLFLRPRRERWRRLRESAALNELITKAVDLHVLPRLADHWMEVRAAARTTPPSDARDPKGTWIQIGEELVAIQMVGLFRQTFVQLKNLSLSIIAIALLLLWAVNSYPFMPRGLLNAYCATLITWTVASLIMAVVRFNRDEVLSYINHTPPNQFTWDRNLLLPFLAFGAVPVLGTVSLGYPALENTLFSWVRVLEQLLRV